MTRLSVNINKIALLRNARGRNYPDVAAFASRCLELGAHGITLHPRPDERHARFRDIPELKAICREHGAEINVEGYPSAEFVEAVLSNRPDQCTLVPDAPGQITSDHGWNVEDSAALLGPVIERLRAAGIRSSLFVDYTMQGFETVRQLGADRIELYTEPYALAWEDHNWTPLLDAFEQAAGRAQAAGLGVNAGHDLNLNNLKDFLRIPGILEVSIGHALVVECIEWGIEHVIRRYVALVAASA